MFGPAPTPAMPFSRTYTRPQLQPQSQDVEIWAPTSDPNVDRLVEHHIRGPNQICDALQFPALFEWNWLRPA
eukprot:8519479-Alexandrium_andersonii.AAC.1